jgi:hypothetical protein
MEITYKYIHDSRKVLCSSQAFGHEVSDKHKRYKTDHSGQPLDLVALHEQFLETLDELFLIISLAIIVRFKVNNQG